MLSKIPPLHLWNGRNWTARHPLSAQGLLELAKGRKPRVPLKDRFRRLWCVLKGHNLVTDRWHNAINPNWFEEKDYELHIRCRRCSFLLTLDPKIYGEGVDRDHHNT